MYDYTVHRIRPYKGLRCTFANENGFYWITEDVFKHPQIAGWMYGIVRYPFVPGYNVVKFDDDDSEGEIVISNHKTLTEAGAILRLLLTTPGALEYTDDRS